MSAAGWILLGIVLAAIAAGIIAYLLRRGAAPYQGQPTIPPDLRVIDHALDRKRDQVATEADDEVAARFGRNFSPKGKP